MRLSRPLRRSRVNGVPEWASCSEKKILTFTLPGAGSPGQSLPFNTLFNAYNHTLSATTRARAIASAYQYYRIKMVTFRFKPETDTFVTGTTLPMLYYQVDKTSTCSQFTAISQFRGQGCRGIPFNREIVVRYKPAVSSGGVDNQPTVGSFVQAKPMISPWLTTNQNAGNVLSPAWQPSQVDHMGIIWGVESVTANPNATTFYKVEFELEFEFKKPLVTVVPPTEEQLPVYIVGSDALGDGKDDTVLKA